MAQVETDPPTFYRDNLSNIFADDAGDAELLRHAFGDFFQLEESDYNEPVPLPNYEGYCGVSDSDSQHQHSPSGNVPPSEIRDI